ncbi:hypothetical protein [Sphaerisporangium sp. NPDC051011]|uniref:hypothetical protein n=1 Tax=Sphaerisporangium sp. NPDC051011 TaxID=3155792 RepID=UPI0033F45F23
MNDVDRTIDRLVSDIAPDPGPGMTPLARELFEEITRAVAPAPPRRRWAVKPRSRWIAALTAVAAVAAIGVGSAPASAALDIKRDGDYYIITVKDLFANPDVYQAELRARGLDIDLTVLPTSASNARTLFVINGVQPREPGRPVSGDVRTPITTVDEPGPCERFGGCAATLKVPVGYKEKAEIVLGREARPGEEYKLPPGIDLPGEPLHCVRYVNMTVAEILPILRERGVEPQFTSYGTKTFAPTAPGGWYVHEGVMSAAGKARILVMPTPNPKPRPFNAFCKSGS